MEPDSISNRHIPGVTLIPEYERKDKEKNALWDKEPLILLIAKAVTEQNGQSGLG